MLFKKIPAVDRLLLIPKIIEAMDAYPRSLVLKSINDVLDNIREKIRKGDFSSESELSPESVSILVVEKLEELSLPSLRPLIIRLSLVFGWLHLAMSY